GFGMAGMLLLIVFITQVINQHISLYILSLGTTRITDRFIPFYVLFFKKLIVMSSILFIVYFGIRYPECVINGMRIFRRYSNLSFKWVPIFTAYFQAAICLAISINTDFTTMFSMRVIMPVGLVSMLLATFMLLAVRRMKLSPLLSMWLPAGNRRVPKRGMRKMLPDPIRAQHPLFIPIKPDRPLQRVFLLHARPDAPFIEPLINYLRARGITSETLPNLITSCQAVIIVLSPWLNENKKLSEIWKSALDVRMPIIPLLLQDAELPLELRHLNWIDARSDPGKVYEEIASILRGQASLASYHVPHQAPKRDAPVSVLIIGLAIMLSSGLKVLLAGFVFPFSLWFYPECIPSHWVAAGMLLILGYLQYLSMKIFIYRRISYYNMIAVQLAMMILGWICSHNMSPVTASLSLLSPALLILLDGVALGAIVCAPDIRQWAPGGLFLRIRPFHSGIHETRGINYNIALALTVMVVLMPGISASREIIYRQGAVLVSGQPILGRFGQNGESHRWILSSQRGDSGTIIAEGITIGFRPDISLYNAQGNEIASGEIENFQQTIINYIISSEEPYYIKIKPMYSGKGRGEVYRLTTTKNRQP
ncbi:MAG: toll/interleukin-1 receptor domain-containing protein, partial [Candidatus Aureabacteria bacterium]|nr:toll/interleukin-1 receptor domain-containing protein [Candidatus Auribacterota bacterium]